MLECLRRPGLKNCWHSIGFCKVSKTERRSSHDFAYFKMHQRDSGIDLFRINWKSGTLTGEGHFPGETFWIFSNPLFSRFAFCWCSSCCCTIIMVCSIFNVHCSLLFNFVQWLLLLLSDQTKSIGSINQSITSAYMKHVTSTHNMLLITSFECDMMCWIISIQWYVQSNKQLKLT